METFKADYKGTCAICLCTVWPGNDLVRAKVVVLGQVTERNVHAHCQEPSDEIHPDDDSMAYLRRD